MEKKQLIHQIFKTLPDKQVFEPSIRRASPRALTLDEKNMELSLKNALRYIPEEHHELMAKEFLEELTTTGRIYGYRFRPEGNIVAKPISEYKGKCITGKAIQLMIDNNLDFDIALYPYELVTYGETGQVCQNWMQYNLIKAYLEIMEEDQTLVVSSGHPVGLFSTTQQAPGIILSNGLLIGKYNNNETFNKCAALGVSNYGQFTAGGWFYIGSQGIVHGTYSTLLAIAREKLGNTNEEMLKNSLYVSAGLGGMSGAQGKAVELCNGVGIIAEVDYSKIELRKRLNWISEVETTEKGAFDRALYCMANGISTSIAFHGNVVDLIQYAVDENIKIDILTDQTSCHVAFDGGYCPQGLTFEQRSKVLKEDKNKFVELVKETLIKHHELIEIMRSRGTYFFDYGNSLTSTMFDIGILDVCNNKKDALDGFIYKSFVEEFMGPTLFDYGYGPFRWVCLSGNDLDLKKTDEAAMSCIDYNRRFQDYDNYLWIKNAEKNQLVVGSKARILYQDGETRIKIALKFNEMVRNKEVEPIIIGRDHMDTGGVDAPSRETSNIKDGSNVTADMSALCFAGDAALGMSMVSMHNGGGTGIGNSQSCGYGLVLDGSMAVDEVIVKAINYDVMCGVARRSWARNENAMETIKAHSNEKDVLTLPNIVEETLIRKTIEGSRR